MKKLALVCAAVLMLTACGLGARGNSLDDQVARVEAGYNAALRIIIEGRTPCVDNDTSNDDLCYVDDELYNKIDPVIDKADEALNRARDYALADDSENVGVWLDNFRGHFDSIESVVELVKDKL